MGGVVLEHVDGILGVNEGVVDGEDVDVVVLNAVALNMLAIRSSCCPADKMQR